MADAIESISKMKVADLKRELKSRGLNTTGNKTELTERLLTALESDQSKTDILNSDELIEDVLNDDDLDEEIEEEEDDDEEEVEKALETESAMVNAGDKEEGISTTLNIPLNKKRKASESAVGNGKAPLKKIVLNRTLSVSSQSKTEEEKKSEEVTNTEEIKNESSEPQKKVIKLSNLSAKERLEMRAKKFGTPLNDDLKKEVRSARFGTNSTVTSTSTSTVVAKVAENDNKIDLLKKRAERFGVSVSSEMSKLDMQERLERRKMRFGAVNKTNVVTTKGTIVK